MKGIVQNISGGKFTTKCNVMLAVPGAQYSFGQPLGGDGPPVGCK